MKQIGCLKFLVLGYVLLGPPAHGLTYGQNEANTKSAVRSQDTGRAVTAVQDVQDVQDVEAMKEAMKEAMAEMQRRMQEAAQDTTNDVEVELVEGAAVMGNPFGFDSKKMVAAKRFQLSQSFQVEIELIQRLCEPTPQQMAKLRVGSKGAVKKLADEWWKKSGQRFGGVAMEMGEQDSDEEQQQGQESEEETVVEIKDGNEIDDSLAQMVLMNGMGNPLQAVVPAEEKAWKALVAGILTAEQSAKLTTYKTEQLDERRREMLQTIVGTLGRELQLTAETKQRLHETLKPHFEKAEIRCIAFFEPYMSYYFAAKAPNEELAEFLSPAQIQAMRMLLWPAREIERMMGQEADE